MFFDNVTSISGEQVKRAILHWPCVVYIHPKTSIIPKLHDLFSAYYKKWEYLQGSNVKCLTSAYILSALVQYGWKRRLHWLSVMIVLFITTMSLSEYLVRYCCWQLYMRDFIIALFRNILWASSEGLTKLLCYNVVIQCIILCYNILGVSFSGY